MKAWLSYWILQDLLLMMLNLLWSYISKICSSHWIVSACVHICHILWKCLVTKADMMKHWRSKQSSAVHSSLRSVMIPPSTCSVSFISLLCSPNSSFTFPVTESIIFIFLFNLGLYYLVLSFFFVWLGQSGSWDFNFYSTFCIFHFSFFIESYSCFLDTILFQISLRLLIKNFLFQKILSSISLLFLFSLVSFSLCVYLCYGTGFLWFYGDT